MLGQEKGRIGESSGLLSPAELSSFWQESHDPYTCAASNPVAPAYSKFLWDMKISLAIEGSLCFGAASGR